MARVACDLSDVLNATVTTLVGAGVVTVPNCWLTLDPDQLPPATAEPPCAGVSFSAFDQRPDTQHVEMDFDDTPVMDGELIVGLWMRLQVDVAGQDTAGITDQTLGMTRLVREAIACLNNVDLTDPAGDVLTWRSLTLLGFRNRGRLGDWRRVDVRFDCCFSYDPAGPATGSKAIRQPGGSPVRNPFGGVLEEN